MDGDARTTGSRRRGILALVAVLVIGVVAGALGDRVILRPAAIGEARRGDGARGRGERPAEAEMIPVPLLQLDLTPEEETRLHAIARQWRPRAAAEVESVRTHVSEMENGMFADMLCALTPAQRDRYLAMATQAHMPAAVIEKRFAIVRANKCPPSP